MPPPGTYAIYSQKIQEKIISFASTLPISFYFNQKFAHGTLELSVFDILTFGMQRGHLRPLRTPTRVNNEENKVRVLMTKKKTVVQMRVVVLCLHVFLNIYHFSFQLLLSIFFKP